MAAEGQAALGQKKPLILVVDDEEAIRKFAARCPVQRRVRCTGGMQRQTRDRVLQLVAGGSRRDRSDDAGNGRNRDDPGNPPGTPLVLPKVPVIAMAGFLGSYLQAARYFGANPIFRKPLDFEELLDAVRRLIGAARQA